MSDKEIIPLPTSPACFVCGEDNPSGLKARFYVENGMVKLPLTARECHCGYPGVIHGGVVSAALDECMGWAAARSIHRMCVTGELCIRFLKPVPPDAGLVVTAEVTRSSRRLVFTRAFLEGPDGARYAQAEGKFMPLSTEETLRVDSGMIYRGNEERVFDILRESAGS